MSGLVKAAEMKEMTANYLHVQAGRFHLLLDGEAVHDIIEHGAASRVESGEFLAWRGSMLPVVVFRDMAGDAPESFDGGVSLVYSPASHRQPLLLHVDRVVGVLEIEESAWLHPPPMRDVVENLFDGVCVDANRGIRLYHLRRNGFEVSA